MPKLTTIEIRAAMVGHALVETKANALGVAARWYDVFTEQNQRDAEVLAAMLPELRRLERGAA